MIAGNGCDQVSCGDREEEMWNNVPGFSHVQCMVVMGKSKKVLEVERQNFLGGNSGVVSLGVLETVVGRPCADCSF